MSKVMTVHPAGRTRRERTIRPLPGGGNASCRPAMNKIGVTVDGFMEARPGSPLGADPAAVPLIRCCFQDTPLSEQEEHP